MNRGTVSVLLSSFDDPTQAALWTGVRDTFAGQDDYGAVPHLGVPPLHQTTPDRGLIDLGHCLSEAQLAELVARGLRPCLVQHASDVGPGVAFHLERMAERAVAQLVQRGGRQQVALLTGDASSAFSRQCQVAFQQAMQRRGLASASDSFIRGGATLQQSTEALADFIAAGGAFDGLLVSSTPLALAALRILKAHRLHVPRDVCLIAFEDSAEAQRIGLTTFDADWQMLGRAAARQCLAQLRSGALYGQTLVDAPLVLRSTCQAR